VTYGRLRAAEALRATTALGVPKSNVVFLGFPDGSTHFLWGPNWSGPPSLGVNGARKVPYSFAFKPGAPYTGNELQAELVQIVKQVRPTTVLIPDANDVHRDHWATNAFSQAALLQSGFGGITLTYLVHRTGYPDRWGSQPERPMGAPKALAGTGMKWLSLPINGSAEQAQNAALADYSTQLKADGPLVRAFVRPNEVFGMAPSTFIGTGTVTLREGAHDPVFRGSQPSASVNAIQFSRADSSTTVTLRLDAAVKPKIVYALHVRTFGADGTMRSYDALVSDGKLHATRSSRTSVAQPGRLLAEKGGAISVKLPAQLLDGAGWLFVGADTYSGLLTADHAAWRMVRLLPR
jgi:N-acetyl-1-D-myo-inositol-2-amino-2-deoxy-alpha-D-glucopyranoside deacetylase